MSTYNEKVDEFHVAFDHPRNNVEDNVSLKDRQQRVNLIFEENKELAQASDVMGTFQLRCLETLSEISSGTRDFLETLYEDGNLDEDGDNVDKVEELDALCDIQYVLSGAIISLGHYANFDKAFDDVHISNMSKMCSTIREVDETIVFHTTKEKEPIDKDNIKYTKKGDKFIVYRISDNKVLKNVHYVAVNLEKYV